MVHDACGVGFIAACAPGTPARGRRARGPNHDIVEHGLTALRRLTHRGAPAALGSVDGCGVMTAIPWSLIGAGVRRVGGTRVLGMIFVRPGDRGAAVAIVERELRAAGARRITWREVPTQPDRVLPAQQATTPIVLQAVARFDGHRAGAETHLFRARLRIERAAREEGVGLSVASLSTRTVVYKALVTPDALEGFYPDLADARFTTNFIVFHQRFSTNTTADWALTQPFRVLAHNGEVNTIGGNRQWMRARALDPTSIRGFEDETPVSVNGSDSRSLDDAVDVMLRHGYSLTHALSRLVPPAWERDPSISSNLRAFHEFQSLVGEPWDGPSALVFSDGRRVGAALDRNGFRPARIVSTADGLIAVASEAGVLRDDEHEIVDRSRLGPGEIIAVDLERGSVMRTARIRRELARQRPYRHMVSKIVRRIEDVPARVPLQPDLARVQAAFGCSREELELILKPMMTDGHEAVGSMGDDAPPAVLSARPRLFTDYFRQRFAQVTNPSVDPYREAAVMSLSTLIGAQGSYVDERSPRPPRLALDSPILTSGQFDRLKSLGEWAPATLDLTFECRGGSASFAARLEAVAAEACTAVRGGSALLVLTDGLVDEQRVALPALLATSVVHHALINAGLRMRASLVVDTRDARDAHQVAALFAYGASAVHPALGYAIAAASTPASTEGVVARYRVALERGLLTIMSKMGVCTFSGYCGAQLFETLGLDQGFVDRCFPGTVSPVGGATLDDIAAAVLERHRRAFAAREPVLEYPGLHGYRRDGEYHATNPLVVRSLQRAVEEPHAYSTFTSHVYNRPPSAIRDLLEFAPAPPIPLDHVESVDAICRRFFVSAMSVGALSPEAHRTIAEAMHQLGARSNSGEGGEESSRFGRIDGSRTKQVASARFGVTPAYLRSADELQIKIAQGSKPGEGGQLPGIKVVPHIAHLRHAQPGTTLISPPVHHDIYSIEDLAELIHDLRAFHPAARINVKLVSSTGVGIIATGVAKAGADAIQISGHDGGTGASPRASIKHAGMPWEVGLADAHRSLTAAGLRGRIVLQTDGGLKTGRDIAMAAALGADEYGFGTAALVALGCVMARQCHANTCPVGIATQRDDLRADFAGTPGMLVGYLRLVAGEVRSILASVGVTRIEDVIGRGDLLRRREDATPTVTVDWLLASRGRQSQVISPQSRVIGHQPSGDRASSSTLEMPRLTGGLITNGDRAFGADIAGALAARFGDAGLPPGSVHLSVAGSAGQSFGAFAVPGMRLVLTGDANDGVGKGMHGGEIVVTPRASERRRSRQVLVGNAALYGATGGRLFVAGTAGERFAIRNSGASAVVEGVGDHACEYMTGGLIVVLGPVGRNLGAGMTGGAVYVWDADRAASALEGSHALEIDAPDATDLVAVRALLSSHERFTGSRVARAILRRDMRLWTFRRLAPASPSSTRQAVNE